MAMKRIGIVIIALWILLLGIFITFYNHDRLEKFHKEYRTLTINDEIEGRITALHIEKGASFITLNDSIKLFVKSSINYLYEEKYLSELLNVDDILIKKRNSDSLFIVKKYELYFFILSSTINEE